MIFKGNKKRLNQLINAAIAEDDCVHDITTDNLIPSAQSATAVITVKEPAVICGLFLAKDILCRFDKRITCKILVKEGRAVKRNTAVLSIKGRLQAILKAERIVLNFISHLSGIATKTRTAVNMVKKTKAVVLDTRKTTPGLRELEKYAVICGGGTNHRLNLSSMAMIKDNHLDFFADALSLQEAVGKIKSRTKKRVEVEIDRIGQLEQALASKADIILLDNMSVAQMRRAVKIVSKMKGKRPLLEASGGIALKNLKSVAQSGVDRISLGSLTHSADAINISLELKS